MLSCTHVTVLSLIYCIPVEYCNSSQNHTIVVKTIQKNCNVHLICFCVCLVESGSSVVGREKYCKCKDNRLPGTRNTIHGICFRKWSVSLKIHNTHTHTNTYTHTHTITQVNLQQICFIFITIHPQLIYTLYSCK
jgi:hypothetical protein